MNREVVWELRQFISKTAPSANTINDSNEDIEDSLSPKTSIFL